MNTIVRSVKKDFIRVGYSGADITIPSGATNAENYINQALSVGSTILLPNASPYIVSASISAVTDRIFRGLGTGSIIKTGNNANIHTLSISGADNFYVRDLQFDGNKANNASQTGHIIRLDTCSNIHLEDLYIHDSGLHGIISNTAVNDLFVNSVKTINNGVSSNGSGLYLNGTTRAFIDNLTTGGNQLDGLQWKTSDKIVVGKVVSYSNGRFGIYAIDGHADISTVNLYSNSNIGLAVENSGLNTTTVNVTTGEIYSNANDGIRITSSNACGLANLRVYNNATGATGAGLRIRATNLGETCNRHKIIGCSFFDSQGSPTQKYGIWATGGGTIDSNIVTGNQMHGNITAAFQKDTWGVANIDANNIVV